MDELDANENKFGELEVDTDFSTEEDWKPVDETTKKVNPNRIINTKLFLVSTYI